MGVTENEAMPDIKLEMSLYKIADAIQIPLQCKGNTVIASGRLRVMLQPGLEIPLVINAVKLFQGTHVGVVFHIRGDLYLIVAHYQKSSVVSAFLVDQSKVVGGLATPMIRNDMGLKEVIDTLGKGVVRSLYYKKDATAWLPLKLA